MKQFSFLTWKVYSDTKEVFLAIRDIHKTLSTTDQKSIGNQLLRSSLSTLLNTAEGSGKFSDKEFIRFIEIALGSLYETRAGIDILVSIKVLAPKTAENLESRLTEIAKQLGGLKKRAKIK